MAGCFLGNIIRLVVYISLLTVTAQSTDPVIVTFAVDVPHSFVSSGVGGIIISTVISQIPSLFGIEDEYVLDVSTYNADGLLGVKIELDPSTPNLDTAILAARLFIGSGDSFDIGFMSISAVENSFQVIFQVIPSTEANVYSTKVTTESDEIETTTYAYVETTSKAVTETVQQTRDTDSETSTQDKTKAAGTEVTTPAYNLLMESKIMTTDISTKINVYSTERTTLSGVIESTTNGKKETNKATHTEATTQAAITSRESKITTKVPVYSTDWIEVSFAVDVPYLYVELFGSDIFVTAIRTEIPELFDGIEDHHIQDIRLYDVDGNIGTTIEVDPSTPNIKTILSLVKAFVASGGTVPTEFMDVTTIPGSYKEKFPDNLLEGTEKTTAVGLAETTKPFTVTETVQQTSDIDSETSTQDKTKAAGTEVATQAYNMSIESKITTKVISIKISTVESHSQTVTLNVATTMQLDITDASTSATDHTNNTTETEETETPIDYENAANLGLTPSALMSMALVTVLALNR